LRPEELARISRLELRARQVVEGFVSGLHRSPYFGQSLEFRQHREYVAGDDLRRIDWKLWSRSDRYYLKQYEEDTNVRVMLAVDGSESMQFGSGAMTKFDYARTLAAAVSMLALKQHDSAGVCVFDSRMRSQIPASSSSHHLQAILQGLEVQAAEGRTDMLAVLKRVNEILTRRSIVVLFSDLLCPRDDVFRGLQLLRQQHRRPLLLRHRHLHWVQQVRNRRRCSDNSRSSSCRSQCTVTTFSSCCRCPVGIAPAVFSCAVFPGHFACAIAPVVYGLCTCDACQGRQLKPTPLPLC